MARSGTVRTGTPDGTRDQQSLGDLVALALKDVSKLIRYEISLAKSELRVDVKRVGLAAGLIGGAGLVLFYRGLAAGTNLKFTAFLCSSSAFMKASPAATFWPGPRRCPTSRINSPPTSSG